MRAKTEEMLKKAHALLAKGIPLSGRDLGEKCGLGETAGHRIIRKLREQKVGVIPGLQGYVLAEHATPRDDLYFLRRLMGHRASAYLALSTAFPEMEKRARALEHPYNLKSIAAPLMPSPQELDRGMMMIERKSEELGI